MDYEALETELANKLIAYFSTTTGADDNSLDAVFTARTMPENDDEFTRDGGKAIVNVHYSGSTYDNTRSPGPVIQDETITIACFIQARQLRGVKGAFLLLKHLKTCLLGYKPVNAQTRMQISSYGDWQMNGQGGLFPFLEFSFKTKSVQIDDQPSPIGGVLKHATTWTKEEAEAGSENS